MAYRHYTNLHERFQGDLISKLNADIESLDFMDHPCNCNKTSCVNGEYAYRGKCRSTCIIYKAQCKICNEAYVGCTQDTFKKRMTHHFSDVTRLTSTSKPVLPSDDSRRSDTFAKHFAKHFPQDATPQQLWENLNLDVLWQGNPLSCVNTFKMPKCCLCTMERLFIFKLTASKKIK